MNKNVFVVILAGGSGTRFWPKSRMLSPKQLCKIGDSDKTLIENTLDRLDDFIPVENRLIVTHSLQFEKTNQLVGKRVAKILAEPEARNTACALAMAALEIKYGFEGTNDDTIMISLHADSLIDNLELFQSSLLDAVTVAQRGQLTLLGIKPTHPETGFGYIEKGEYSPLDHNQDKVAFKVKSFLEKPHFDLAKKYFESGNYLWNSGMFTWPVSLILKELSQRLPVIVDSLESFVKENGSFNSKNFEKLSSIYRTLPKIAIDNAVLEVSNYVSCIEVKFGWKDIGSWDALSDAFETDDSGNLLYGESVLIDCKNVTVDSDGPLIGAIGLRDFVVVAAKNAVLVCPKSEAQKVKKIVEKLSEAKRTEYI